MKRRVRSVLLERTALLLAVAPSFLAAQPQSLEERLNALEAQNKQLTEELSAQKKTISELQSRLGERSEPDLSAPPPTGLRFGRLQISGEGGVAFFHTGSEGQHPNGSFRVDEAKLFLEAPIWDSTYIFSELDLVIREANDEFFHLGELYIDFENILRHWTDHNYLSVRVGRIDIPFGEEYLVRDVIDNPLISRSLSDLWGVDEGIEVYGSAFGFDYVLAVQNGGHPTLEDFESDKSVAGRIGYNFGDRGRISISGLRTGELSTEDDKMSELWIGNGFFRSLGPAETTPTFEATVFELDGQVFWTTGHLKLAGGYFEYEDADSTMNRTREGYYYYAEALQDLPKKFYTAARLSHILSDDGMPIVGYGDFGKYFFGPLTTDLWRLSLGLGYRWNENLLAKVEYALEEGELLNGLDRNHHNFVGAEIGFKF